MFIHPKLGLYKLIIQFSDNKAVIYTYNNRRYHIIHLLI
jgi:hypothetical protein